MKRQSAWRIGKSKIKAQGSKAKAERSRHINSRLKQAIKKSEKKYS